MVQLLLHLRDSMHHYQGICLSNYLFDKLQSIFLFACCLSNWVLIRSLMKFCDFRPCVLYSDNTLHNSAEVAEDLSKCCIKEVEKPHMDRSCGIPMARLPLQVPQSIQGVIFLSLCFCPTTFCLNGFLHASFSIWAFLVFRGIPAADLLHKKYLYNIFFITVFMLLT